MHDLPMSRRPQITASNCWTLCLRTGESDIPEDVSGISPETSQDERIA